MPKKEPACGGAGGPTVALRATDFLAHAKRMMLHVKTKNQLDRSFFQLIEDNQVHLGVPVDSFEHRTLLIAAAIYFIEAYRKFLSGELVAFKKAKTFASIVQRLSDYPNVDILTTDKHNKTAYQYLCEYEQEIKIAVSVDERISALLRAYNAASLFDETKERVKQALAKQMLKNGHAGGGEQARGILIDSTTGLVTSAPVVMSKGESLALPPELKFTRHQTPEEMPQQLKRFADMVQLKTHSTLVRMAAEAPELLLDVEISISAREKELLEGHSKLKKFKENGCDIVPQDNGAFILRFENLPYTALNATGPGIKAPICARYLDYLRTIRAPVQAASVDEFTAAAAAIMGVSPVFPFMAAAARGIASAPEAASAAASASLED